MTKEERQEAQKQAVLEGRPVAIGRCVQRGSHRGYSYWEWRAVPHGERIAGTGHGPILARSPDSYGRGRGPRSDYQRYAERVADEVLAAGWALGGDLAVVAIR